MLTFSELGQWGRLGNQMYEYAALLGIAEELGYEVAIPPMDQHNLGECFDLSSRIMTRRDRRRIKHRFHEPRIGFSDRYRAIDDSTDLTGYFQSPRYFPRREIVQAEFTFRPELLATADSMLRPYRTAGRPVVGVTVRRGDYQLNPGSSSSCGPPTFMIERSRWFPSGSRVIWCSSFRPTNPIGVVRISPTTEW